jgi:hypothetical protein
MAPIATNAPIDDISSTITTKLANLLSSSPSEEKVIKYGTAAHPYSTLPETKEDLPWADLITLQLSRFNEPGGKQALAEQLRQAVKLTGSVGHLSLSRFETTRRWLSLCGCRFFYITDFGIPWEEVDAQFALGKEVFDLPIETKAKHQADFANGGCKLCPSSYFETSQADSCLSIR